MAIPDVRVKLSAEGISEVQDAFRKIASESAKMGRQGKAAMDLMHQAASQLKSIIPTIDLGRIVSGVTSFLKESLKAADTIGDMSKATGMSAEAISTYALAAKKAGAEQGVLEIGIKKFAIALHGLRSGSKEIADSFAEIGLSVKDFQGLSPDQAFQKVANALGNATGSFDRAAVAAKIFGRGGADLLEVLDAVANDGFRAIQEEGRKAGLIMSDELAQSAGDAVAMMGQLEARAQGAANQFLTGLLPALQSAMDAMDESTSIGVSGFQTMGKAIGYVIDALVLLIRTLGRVTSSYWTVLSGMAESIAQLVQGNFQAAKAIAFRTIDEIDFKITRSTDEISAFWDQVSGKKVKAGTVEGPKVTPTVIDAAAEAQAKQSAKNVADWIVKEMKRTRDKAQADTREKAAELKRQESELTSIILSAQRDRNDAVEKLIVEYNQKLAAIDELKMTDPAKRNAAKMELTRAFLDDLEKEYQKSQDQINEDWEKFYDTQEKYQADSMAQQMEAVQRFNDMVLDKLRSAVAALEAANEAAAEAEAAQAEIEQRIREASASYQLQVGTIQSLESSLSEFFGRGITEAESFGEAIRNLALSIVQSIQQIIAQLLAARIVAGIAGLFGMATPAVGSAAGSTAVSVASGGLIHGPGTGTSDSVPAMLSAGEFVVRAAAVQQPGVLEHLRDINRGMRPVVSVASGGLIHGPGTGTSDSVPAMLSAGEFVVRAAAVQQPGVLEHLRDINRGMRPVVVRESRVTESLRELDRTIIRMAEGGLVPPAAASPGMASIDGQVTVALADGLVAQSMTQPAYSRNLMKVIAKNRRAFRQALGV